MKLLRRPISASGQILRHQYGIPVAESQTFLLAKRTSAAMSEEKRLPLDSFFLVFLIPLFSRIFQNFSPR